MTKTTNYLKALAALVTLAALIALTMAVASNPAEAGKKKPPKPVPVRVAFQTLDDSLSGADGTAATTKIKAPSAGFLVIDASATVVNIQELDRLGCFIEVDNVLTEHSTRLMQVNGDKDVNEQEICATNTVVPVAAGSHTVDFESTGIGSIHTNFNEVALTAMFVPLDGNGKPPKV